jgi:hypothetical protein
MTFTISEYWLGVISGASEMLVVLVALGVVLARAKRDKK